MSMIEQSFWCNAEGLRGPFHSFLLFFERRYVQSSKLWLLWVLSKILIALVLQPSRPGARPPHPPPARVASSACYRNLFCRALSWWPWSLRSVQTWAVRTLCVAMVLAVSNLTPRSLLKPLKQSSLCHQKPRQLRKLPQQVLRRPYSNREAPVRRMLHLPPS